MESLINHEAYYSMDSKLRALHGQPWSSSSSSFYVPHPGAQPSSSVYSHSGDSNSEYKHSTREATQDLEGKELPVSPSSQRWSVQSSDHLLR